MAVAADNRDLVLLIEQEKYLLWDVHTFSQQTTNIYKYTFALVAIVRGMLLSAGVVQQCRNSLQCVKMVSE